LDWEYVARSLFLYSCEIWTLAQRNIRRLKIADACFTGRIAGYNLLNHRNENGLQELKVDLVEKELAKYKQKWINHVGRMEDIRHKKTTS
jgi:hypothetical protein